MASYSARLLTCASLLNSAGGSNLRCSFRMESMLGPWVSTTALSAMMRTSTRRNIFRAGKRGTRSQECILHSAERDVIRITRASKALTTEDAEDTEVRTGSLVQEAGSGFCTWYGTGVVASEDAVAVAGDDAVSPVADRARQELQQPSSQPPECGSVCGLSGSGCWFWLCGFGSQTRTGRAQLGGSQVPEDEDDSIRPSQQLFVAKPIVNDHIHSIEILSIHPVPRQNPPRQLTLQRGKSKEPIRIAPQNELHQPVAEAANAVVKEIG